MKSQAINDTLVDGRLDRLGRFLMICAVAWAVFGLFYGCVLGHFGTSVICGVESIITFAMLPFTSGPAERRRFVANVFLICSCSGLVFLGLITGQADSHSPIFLSCAGLLAARLMGIRAATLWTMLAVLGCIFVHYGFRPDVIPTVNPSSNFDKLLSYVAVTVIIFLLSLQAECFFRKQTERLVFLTEELQERTRLLTLAEEAALVGHWRFDVDSKQITLSEQMRRICGVSLEPGQQLYLMDWLEGFTNKDGKRFLDALEKAQKIRHGFSLELSFRLDGQTRHVTCRGFPEQDATGKVTSVFGIFKDDTDARHAAAALSDKAAALRQLATFDPLTGLANRHHFQSELEKTIHRAKQANSQVALLLIDMDGFKEINDTMGHPCGDAILREIAQRLQEVVGGENVVARLGGDEFTVILDSVESLIAVTLAGAEIASAISQPYFLEGKEVSLGASIGAALYPQHSESIDELLAYADTAMYRAKAKHKHIEIYHPSMTDVLVRRRQLENEVSQALDNDEFRLVFQPQIDIGDGNICGFEALLRWNKDDETVSPDDFVPALESSGSIVAVGPWLLRESCRQAKLWIDAGYDLCMSVNISPLQFHDPQIMQHVVEALETTGLDPHRLDLEITESILIEEVDQTASKLFELKDLGITISIDDFGTGYSSLAYLKHFPIDRLKIDRTFVKDIPENDDGTIAFSMVMLAHNLEIKVTAEGVETQEQLDCLASYGCDEYQGYLLSPPQSAVECEKMLAQFGRRQSEKPTVSEADVELAMVVNAAAETGRPTG